MSEVHYVYVDEAGQVDGRGDAFHVGIVIVPSSLKEEIQQQIERMEQVVGKRGKWHGCSVKVKTSFLEAVFGVPLTGLYWYRTTEPCDYHEATAAAACRAMQCVASEESQFILVVDALKKPMRQQVSRILRDHGIRWRDIHVGKREEVEPLLRLADAIAGFTRDVHHEKPYTSELWRAGTTLLTAV